MTKEKDNWKAADFYALWVQRGGSIMRIRDMSDRHLTNILRMLKRNTETKQADEFFAITGRCDVEGDILETVDNLMSKNWVQLYLVNSKMSEVDNLWSLLIEAHARSIQWEIADVATLSDKPRGDSGVVARMHTDDDYLLGDL